MFFVQKKNKNNNNNNSDSLFFRTFSFVDIIKSCSMECPSVERWLFFQLLYAMQNWLFLTRPAEISDYWSYQKFTWEGLPWE